MPIDIASGNLHIEKTDIAVPGRLALVWERRYSGALLGGPPGILGPGWTSGLECTLTRLPGAFEFVAPTGAREVLPDPEGLVEQGGVSRHFGANLEVFAQKSRIIVQRWNVESGEVRRFIFLPGRPGTAWPLAAIEDLCGAGLDLRHDDQGRPVSIRQRAEGRTLRLRYDKRGLLGSVALDGPSGEAIEVARYEYGADGALSAAFDALGYADRYVYDRAGRLAREVQKDGGVFAYRYDGAGRCIWSTGLDHYDEKRLRFLTAVRITEVTDSYGRTRRYQHLPTGQISSEWDPLGAEVRTAYDDHGRIVEVVAATGATTRYGYDERGNRSLFVNALGDAFQYTFNENHQVQGITDPNGNLWKHYYDEQNRLSVTEDPSGARWSLTYDHEGNLVALINPSGVSRTFSFERGILAGVTDWKGNATELHFDPFGRLALRRDPLGHVVGRIYDRVGNLVRVNLPDGGRLLAEYDAAGNLVRYEDAAGRIQERRFGACRRLIEELDGNGNRVTYQWGTEPGRLDAVVNALEETYRFTYDAAGRCIQEVAFDGRELRFEYDASGRCVRATNGASEVVEMVRDALGRVVGKRLPDGDESRYAYDKLGNLVEASNREMTIVLERDAVGRLVREVQGQHWLKSETSVLGQTTRLETDLGLVVEYEGDENGFWRALNTGGRAAFQFHRDARGQEIGRSLPSAGSLRQEFDPVGRLVAQRVSWNSHRQQGTGGAFPLSAERVIERAYRRDANGLVQTIRDKSLGVARYSFDPGERLLGVLRDHGVDEQFAYDPAGNLTQIEAREGSHLTTEELSYGPGNRLLRKGNAEYQYDGQGRLVRKIVHRATPEVWTYEWDALDRLRSIVRPDGAVWQYGYDALTRRVRKSGPDEDVRFIWHGNVPVQEVSSRGTITSWLFAQESFVPLAMVRDGRLCSIVSDHLGTPVAMLDESGAAVWRMRARAFGEAVVEDAGISCPFRFQGQYYDAESGLHYNRMRYYDPAVGRFIQQDPLRFASSTNFYKYHTNPIGWIDPLGLCETFYRTMSKEDYEELLKTGKVPATSETFISPTQGFSESYEGVLVKFTVKPGTTEALEGIGVRDNSRIARSEYPEMPPVASGWKEDKAFFKGEGNQVNIGLGKGTALDTFNQNIESHEKVR
jgi:RHS repeat-associated protein